MKDYPICYTIYKSAAKAVGFYDSPLWREGAVKPDYFELFSWKISCFGNNTMFGELREEMFDTEPKKVSYLQGIFEDYSGSHIDDGYLHFANSCNKVERCKKWLFEIGYKNSVFSPVIEHKIKYSIPICHTLRIDRDIIEIIKNYKYE